MSSQQETVEDSRERIEREVKAFLLGEFLQGEDPSLLGGETPLISSGVLDSVSVVRLVDHLELAYGVHIDAHEFSIDCLDTPALIAETVAGKLE
ncbi:MAG TPA: phosphopantetheine-binding protein [Gemmatimonadota bacterium]|jgi:acyl carrier protein